MATRKDAAKTPAKTAKDKADAKTGKSAKTAKGAKKSDGAQPLQKVKTLSHDLLLAGIGAWVSSRDKKKSDKDKGLPDFATLVREGRKAEPELKASLQKTWDEWKEKSSSSRLSKSGDQLRGVFDERVSSAITGLGLPTRKEIDALEAKVDRLMNERSDGRGSKAAAKKPAAKKPAAKKATAAAKRISHTTDSGESAAQDDQ
jgi:poly(hydroxyalkanoate) granule-associated protein